MKIIDLINKIANNEEVPKTIKIRSIVYYRTYNYNTKNINFAYENLREEYWLDNAKLNEKVELMEK